MSDHSKMKGWPAIKDEGREDDSVSELRDQLAAMEKSRDHHKELMLQAAEESNALETQLATERQKREEAERGARDAEERRFIALRLCDEREAMLKKEEAAHAETRRQLEEALEAVKVNPGNTAVLLQQRDILNAKLQEAERDLKHKSMQFGLLLSTRDGMWAKNFVDERDELRAKLSTARKEALADMRRLIESEPEYPTPWPPEKEQEWRDLGVSFQTVAQAAVAEAKRELLARLSTLSEPANTPSGKNQTPGAESLPGGKSPSEPTREADTTKGVGGRAAPYALHGWDFGKEPARASEPAQGEKQANYFAGKTRPELLACVAENLTKLLGNNIWVEVYDRGRPYIVRPEELVVNCHFMDRAGAIVNALCAMGLSWDARDWNRELTAKQDARNKAAPEPERVPSGALALGTDKWESCFGCGTAYLTCLEGAAFCCGNCFHRESAVPSGKEETE